MKSEPFNSNSSSIFHLTIGFVIGAVVVGAVVVGSSWLASREPTSPHNSVHNVTVSYMYETDPGSASGANEMPADSIQFYPGYVVVTGTAGRSDLLAVDRLRKFNFTPTDSKDRISPMH